MYRSEPTSKENGKGILVKFARSTREVLDATHTPRSREVQYSLIMHGSRVCRPEVIRQFVVTKHDVK